MSDSLNPSAEKSSLARIPSLLLLAASLLWCAYWFVHARGYWEDDAYIHLEFARSLAAGHGFAFNGHVVAGDTAPLWVFLLAAVHAVIPDWLAAGKLLTVLGAAFGLAGIYAFARRIALALLPVSSAGMFSAALVLLVVINPYTCYWIFSGMEPLTAAGLACWAVLAATRQRPTALSFLAGCLLAGLGPILRPEMLFLAALLAIPLYGQWRRLDIQPALKLPYFAAGLLLLAGPLLGWSLYSLHAFGHLLPNTNAAKRAGPHESVLRRLLTVYASGLPVVLCGVAVACLHLALHLRAVARSLRSAILRAVTGSSRIAAADSSSASAPALPLEGWIFILWVAIATIFYLADHTYVQTRYVLVTAPGLTVVILALALRLWPRIGLLLYMAGAAAALATSIAIVIPFIRNKSENCSAVRQIAHSMRDRLPPDAPVAVYGIGQIAFESQHPIVDTGGITQPAAIPYLNAQPAAIVHWAHTAGAQYYIASESPEDGAKPVLTVQTPAFGWTVHTSLFNLTVPLSLWKLPPANSQPD